ncbi:MAG: hypothetical protein KDC44_22620 [Phaeodactylibacter sp.]|nr:hypothetical protein [Phaeodactylibacter sp.]
MSTFLANLKWEFTLLQKNNIISISLAVTAIYGLILYLLKGVGSLDKVLVGLVLNDPSVIGYFFVALAIYTEIKHDILPAIFVSPQDSHRFILSKTLAISLVGWVCSLGLALLVKGLDFDILHYSVGAFGICLLSALLGVMMLTFADEFLKFALLSIPLFLPFINLSLLQYLGAMDMGFVKYFLPIQGCLDLIDHAVSGTPINFWYAYGSIVVLVPLFYYFAYRLFTERVVRQ